MIYAMKLIIKRIKEYHPMVFAGLGLVIGTIIGLITIEWLEAF